MSRHPSIEKTLRELYPETAAGGFTRVDGTVDFYGRITALLRPEMRVLDFGAGRGRQLEEDDAPYRRDLCRLRGRVAHVAGVDVDAAVHDNPGMDETHVIEPGGKLPFADESLDLVYADWTLEHVATPEAFEAETRRVLRPGGWFCARTPNRWGITGLAANLVPNRMHADVLAQVQPDRQERDVFPTTYRLNTRGRMRRHFRADRWDDHSYYHSPEPGYFLRSKLATRLANAYTAAVPSALGTNLHAFLRKR